MKKVFSLITLVLLLLTDKTFAISYSDDIKLDLNPYIENTTNNINWARLIEKYLKNLKTEIETFNEKYNINSDKEIDNFLKKLEMMIISLRKIQTVSVEKYTAEDVMRSIVNELKTLNPKIKSYLKVKKTLIVIETKNVKNNYVIFSQKLSRSLTKFINEIKLRSTDENRFEVEKHLNALKKENNKLLSFSELSFDNPYEVKTKFLSILNNINREFLEIKKLVKK